MGCQSARLTGSGLCLPGWLWNMLGMRTTSKAYVGVLDTSWKSQRLHRTLDWGGPSKDGWVHRPIRHCWASKCLHRETGHSQEGKQLGSRVAEPAQAPRPPLCCSPPLIVWCPRGLARGWDRLHPSSNTYSAAAAAISTRYVVRNHLACAALKGYSGHTTH